MATGIATEFGFYPREWDTKTDRFTIETLPGLHEAVAAVAEDPGVAKDWIYSGLQQTRDWGTGTVRTLPYSARVFGMPKTHALKLHEARTQSDLDFVVWCLSLLAGMRLTTTERGFLDATPIRPGKLVDFNHGSSDEATMAGLALDYLDQHKARPLAAKRFIAIIHAFFLAKYPQNLPFERFQYLYSALDGCYKLIFDSQRPSQSVAHGERIQWMCGTYGLPIPAWALHKPGKGSAVATIRNATVHEALFFDEPLGFSVYGGNHAPSDHGLELLQMEGLVTRLLFAILGRADMAYVKSATDSRQRQKLDLTLPSISGQPCVDEPHG